MRAFVCECVCLCVRACVSECACVCLCMFGREKGVQGIQYFIYASFLRFYAYIFVDLGKRGVLTFVGEIQRYTNGRYHSLLFVGFY